jgi:hypothetical protein
VADRGHTDQLFVVAELIDDAITADPQRAKASQPTKKLVPGMGLPFQQTKCVFDGVDQRPAEIEQFLEGASCEDDPWPRVSGLRGAR